MGHLPESLMNNRKSIRDFTDKDGIGNFCSTLKSSRSVIGSFSLRTVPHRGKLIDRFRRDFYIADLQLHKASSAQGSA